MSSPELVLYTVVTNHMHVAIEICNVASETLELHLYSHLMLVNLN